VTSFVGETPIYSRFPRHTGRSGQAAPGQQATQESEALLVPPFSVAASEEKMKAFGNRFFESRTDRGQDGH
jgi:hypothetical protein